MRNIRVYINHSLESGTELELVDETAHYLRNVLRLASGDSIIVFNGEGSDFDALIKDAGKRRFLIAIGHRRSAIPASGLSVSLGIGLSRGERMDIAIQKATELGVAEITPLLLTRCNSKLDASRTENRMRHWTQVMISACEQSGRSSLVKLNEPMQLAQWLSSQQHELKLVMHPRDAMSTTLSQWRPASVSLLAGPEGGLTDNEVADAKTCGFRAWQLGERILRSETAPLAALSIVQYLWGDIGEIARQ